MITQESKRRRVSNLISGGGGTVKRGFDGTTLGELLVHLSSRAPEVRVVALDALGAPLSDRGPELDEAAEALTCTVEGAFVAKVEGLVGSSLGDLEGIDEADVMEALGGGDDEKTIVTIVPCDVAAAAASADASGGGGGGGESSREGGTTATSAAAAVAPSRNTSRAHELLTRRAREVFDAAAAAAARGTAGAGADAGADAGAGAGAGADAGGDGAATGDGGVTGTGTGTGTAQQQQLRKRQQLRALEALVLWLDAHHDVFTAGDPGNIDGRVLAPDPAAGGCLVPARLLHA